MTVAPTGCCACAALCACREPVRGAGGVCQSCADGWHVLPPMAALVREIEKGLEDPDAVLNAARPAREGAN